ncbi:MAG: aminotransferase class I/II-fold pyridoxal phosphate-dependent enzyme, partial [Thermoanaerobaculia bacterium]
PVLVDEVYLDAVFDRGGRPASTHSPNLLSSNSLTKSHGLSSLRCGWTLASPELTGRIRRARDVVDVSGPIPAERLAHLAFQNLDRLLQRARRIVEPNQRLLRESLAAWEPLECAPFAATIAFPRFRDGRDAGPFTARLFERHGVAVVPGAFFGLPSHFRISLGGEPEAFREGIEVIGRSLSEA